MGGIFGGGGVLQEGSSAMQFLVLIALVWGKARAEDGVEQLNPNGNMLPFQPKETTNIEK